MKLALIPGLALLTLATCHPANAEAVSALVERGDAFDIQLQTQQALDCYLAAEQIRPPDAELLRRIAREYAELMPSTDSVREKRELGEKALDYAKRAVAANPSDAQAQLAAAICYGRLAPLLDNKTKIAYSRLVKEHAEKSLKLDPNNDLTYNVLGAWNYELAGLNPILRGIAGIIYGQLPDASYEEALRNFQKAVGLNPKRLGNHVELGRTLAAMGKTTEARTELERGLSMPNAERDDPFEKLRAREALRTL